MKIIRRLLGFALLIAGAFFAGLWWQRAGLPYNEQERYFDSDTAVVYQENSVVVYAGLAVLVALIGAALLLKRPQSG